MSEQIRISPEQMRMRAKEYRTEGTNVDQVISKMDSLLQALQSEWEGSASESYSSRYQELRPGFTRMSELIGEISAALDQTARVMEETDQQIAGYFRT